ncbi:MAG: AbrB/MazE/SpoVT family DNA-binding domain-containing protein [Thermodesulfobacteriota bacterium]|nr:AbrB/MazE/SpoVT family DNA-binding domain-containing protein [Thermodesulfobacteriota bacterium]
MKVAVWSTKTFAHMLNLNHYVINFFFNFNLHNQKQIIFQTLFKYQITIPASIRKNIDIGVGDLMEATICEQGILLKLKMLTDRQIKVEKMKLPSPYLEL